MIDPGAQSRDQEETVSGRLLNIAEQVCAYVQTSYIESSDTAAYCSIVRHPYPHDIHPHTRHIRTISYNVFVCCRNAGTRCGNGVACFKGFCPCCPPRSMLCAGSQGLRALKSTSFARRD